MQSVVEMAKAHLQNVSIKIQELENQKQILQGEIDKLKTYLQSGIETLEKFSNVNE